MKKLYFSPGMLVVTTLLSLAAISAADSPPANTIPIISMKTGQDPTCEDISLEVICKLLWHNFDGIWVEGWLNGTVGTPAALCDSTHATMVLAPARLQELGNSPVHRWGRYTPVTIHSEKAYIRPTPDFSSIADTAYATDVITDIRNRCSTLASNAADYSCIWYYDIFNEGPAWQLYRMKSDAKPYDDYFPSMYTQDTMMVHIDSTGVFSWVKWKSDSIYNAASVYCPSVSVCFSAIHHIDSLRYDTLGFDSTGWAGCVPGVQLGTIHQQANSIRAYFNTKYLEYSPDLPYRIHNNYPERMDLNTYPVRMAGHDWQENRDSITVLGSATDLWMLEHYEEILDSTFSAASSGPFPINYHPQGFGRTGGRAIWEITENQPPDPPDTTINYEAYSYRIPSPAEFRMLCNIGLLRGAKGVFPYSIRSYSGDFDSLGVPHHHDTGLLDENLIPFDDPYENWVYRDRPVSDYYYAPPDSIPPWTAADGSQFDPFYTVPSRPIPAVGDDKNRENYLVWKFAPYARLWNSVKKTFGQIATVAPELSRLWWWYSGNRYDNASISYYGTEPQYFADPQVRVFTDSTESTCYLFHVNRFCRANNNPFKISVNSDSFPRTTDFSVYALDHSRRFIIEGSEPSLGIFEFLDTLDAGEARLLEMFDGSLAADIRITDPDLSPVLPADGDTLTDYRSVQGETVNILARFYNMGTGSLNRVQVYLRDDTYGVMLDTAEVSFTGLSTDSCWKVDRDDAIFSWDTRNANIGVHRLSVYTQQLLNEPDSEDNSATLVYMIRPRDYATEVLDDPWDMTEATGSGAPDWHTDDITAMSGWESTFSDSISGMFEGEITDPSTSAGTMQMSTGSSTGDWIDTSLYQNLTLAAKAERSLDIEVHWIDEHSVEHYIDLGEDVTTTWSEIGPIDLQSLNSEWDDEDATSFWLEFSCGSNLSTAVRIGWIKLTE
ncbi:MAG: hypothetical protein J7K88_03170 [Candidatus Fermentibacteraceae bacterium]|nr:hypothetical protein [Candidatus Fermentibacteraceae bacterium]